MWNVGLDEAQTGIKIAGGNVNNLRYADDTTLMAESKEELKNLLMRVKKESEKAVLKLNIKKKNKIMASSPITSWQIVTVFQSFSHVQLFATPMDCIPSGFHPSLSPRDCTNSCHWVGDAIQPAHLLLSPSFPSFNLSQHQGVFQWVGSLHQVAEVLELQLQHQSFQWILSIDFP